MWLRDVIDKNGLDVSIEVFVWNVYISPFNGTKAEDVKEIEISIKPTRINGEAVKPWCPATLSYPDEVNSGCLK